MTPEQHRAKWDLPSTYPMVAPNYATQRSALAKATGLGQLRETPVVVPPASAGTIKVAAPEPPSAVVSEAVAPEPPTVAQGKAKPNIKRILAPPEDIVKRKPGRLRKATA